MPFMARNAVFQKLAEIADITALSKEDREKYDESIKVMRDNIAAYKGAIIEGRIEGKKDGKEEGRKEFALKLLAHKFPLDEIANLTDLSIEEIKKLEQ